MKDWFDHLLGKVTMYRLVTLSLAALLVLSIFLGAVGYLPYSPLSLLLTSLLLVGSSYGANRLHGWLFGVQPHDESAAITGLILTFIVVPLTTPASSVPLVLIAVIATASKYILVFRGRHIFNPAAVGALFATLSGLSYAVWWVASPALLPLTILISFLILYKTRHLILGLLFVAVSVVLVTAQYVMNGNSIIVAAGTVVTSWPIIFFAGVMLSEPLTLPPRRWQQLTVATLVGVLFSLPIEIGVVSMTPQLALIIGNILAFMWGLRQAIHLKFVEKIQLTPSSYEFIFSPVGSAPRYIAGQYMELTLPHKKPDSRGTRRMFTIATGSWDTNVRFGIKIPKRHSSFKNALINLQAGQVVTATKISGDFVLPDDNKMSLLFIAGGIGITPFVSFARQLASNNETRDIVLVYSARAGEVSYMDIVKKAGFKSIIVTPDAEKPTLGVQYVTASYITRELLSDLVPDIAQRQVYISGPSIMVNHTKQCAKKLGARVIKKDYFTGY